jgi:hypothetical protein
MYKEEAQLVDELSAWAALHLAEGRSLLLVATPGHHRAVEASLSAQGVPVKDLQAKDRLIGRDADDSILHLRHGAITADSFRAFFSDDLARARAASPTGSVAAFGEMVNQLAIHGEPDVAVEFEKAWDALLADDDFSLVCGYRLDPLQEADMQLLERASEHHGHVQAAYDFSATNEAIARAFREAFGDSDTESFGRLGEGAPRSLFGLGSPLSSLVVVRRLTPLFGSKVLHRALARYRREE